MYSLGAMIAIFDDQNRLLLTKREDFEVWCLPGGSLEPDEAIDECAIREAREESGLEIALEGIVGIYPTFINADHFSFHAVCFRAHVVGGTLLRQTDETLDARFFPADALPPLEHWLWWNYQRALDAIADKRGLCLHQKLLWDIPANTERSTLYQMRDQSGLGRYGFYKRHIFDPSLSLMTIHHSQDS
ncbi:hypothetical protein MASR2M15_12990 [Anaerolineales bacterium]